MPLLLSTLIAKVAPHERKPLALGFLCNFVLMTSYYILRPTRDAMATVFGVERLQDLFTGTLVLTLIVSPLFAWLTDTFKLSRVLPGVFALLILSVLGFHVWFEAAPESRWLAAAFYWWFSVINLFMVSVFWSLMVDTFTSGQAARLLPAIAAGGSSGAVAGPLVTSLFVKTVGVGGLLLLSAVGLAGVLALVLVIIGEKRRLQEAHAEAQASTMDHELPGNLFDGFRALFSSSYLANQALFVLLMTWIATIGYFLQTDIVTRTFADLADRTRALADIDLAVNICSIVVLLFGMSRFIKRFGITGSLLLNPILMAISFVLMALSPTLLMLQAMQVVRRVTQYAIFRPVRETCFTVVEQESRYKAKNVIDTVIYRLGDLTSAWGQAGLRMLGFGTGGVLGVGLIAIGMWAVSAWTLGRQYERRRAAGSAPATNVPAIASPAASPPPPR
ncbi:MAG TPA: MFS transporter [Steroidobacteraceae bacterium]|nr:MFS transporter [Steroidobacteraceae bacterium]